MSEIIWPKDSVSFHESTATIHVRADHETTLVVRALRYGGDLVKEQTFAAGKDFEFRSGRLRLHHGWDSSLDEPEAGGIFFVHETTELGIDKKGQGKYKKQAHMIGAAYLVVPLVGRETSEVRFIRLKD